MLIDVKVPVLAESIAEATLMEWEKRPGDPVKRGEVLINIETDKVTLEITALQDGAMAEILRKEGETVQSDEVIARIDTEGATTESAAEPEKKPEPPVPETKDKIGEATGGPQLSPAVRHLLEAHQLDAKAIPITGSRLTKTDVLSYIESGTAKDDQEAAGTGDTAFGLTPSAPVSTGHITDRLEEKVPMTRLRKHAAERLLQAQRENAILSTFNEVNTQTIMDIRKRYKDEFEETHGVKLGFMSFFTRAATEALKKFPAINASVEDDNIVYHGYFDIGIAVASPRGLVVPVVRNTDILSLAEIEKQIRIYSEKARDGKLSIDDLSGGTFTITNGGVFGSLLSTPIINPPQSAILGMHTIKQRPVAENGEVVVRPMMYLALSYDHRIIDGREAVQFLALIKQQLEDPARLLLKL